VGQVVDDALFQVMDDILSLEDIPEADSERLSELCELLAPLEELFVYGSGEVRGLAPVVNLTFLMPAAAVNGRKICSIMVQILVPIMASGSSLAEFSDACVLT
jgi:hypothetical protein